MKCGAQTLTLYRGICDLPLEEIETYYEGTGTFGGGTYWTASEQVAKSYATMGDTGVISRAKIQFKKLLEISNADASGLEQASQDTIKLSSELADFLEVESGVEMPPEELGILAQNKGCDGLSVSGKVDGGAQIIVPTGSRPKVLDLKHKLV